MTAEALPETLDGLPVKPGEFLALVSVDFTGTYQVYLAAKDERIKMTRLSMSLLAAPFAAAVALAGAKVVSPAMLTTWHSVPWYLFAMTAALLPPGSPQAEVDALKTRLAPFVAHAAGAYGNFTNSVAPGLPNRMYPPPVLARLRALKQEWDPGNLFSRNHNLAAAG